ncbi:MAG TPA: TVP38/TMEM64 family protein [Gemmatimonadales bacterium]|nr:TVP38/TMEM64 family protein [Gemmatimonadales bacterium]
MALSPRARGLVKLLALLAVLALAGYALRLSPARTWVTPQGAGKLVAALRQLWWAPPAFVLTYTIASALDFSGLVLTLAGGAVFGFWWGSLLNLMGANLGASAAFWVARLLGREGLQALLGSRLAGLDRLAQQAGFTWLLRLRLIPIVPFNLLNFAAGLTAMPWRAYAAATAIGVLPATLIYTFFADALLSGSHEAGRRVFLRLLVAGMLLVALSFVPTVARRFGWIAPDTADPR